jgi:hypothetical protein
VKFSELPEWWQRPQGARYASMIDENARQLEAQGVDDETARWILAQIKRMVDEQLASEIKQATLLASRSGRLDDEALH